MWRQVFNLPANYGKLKTCRHLGTDTTNKAAGEVLTAKQAPHRPGTAPALGLRAGNDVLSFYRRPMEVPMFRFVSLRRIALALAAFAVLGLAGPVTAGEHVRFKGRLE